MFLIASKISKAEEGARKFKAPFTLSMDSKISSIPSPVIAFVAGASPIPLSPLSHVSVTRTNSTFSTLRRAVIKGDLRGISFISVCIFIIVNVPNLS